MAAILPPPDSIDSIGDQLFITEFLSVVAPTSVNNFQNIGVAVLTLAAVSLGIVLATIVAYAIVAMLSPAAVNNGSYDFGRVSGAIALYLGALFLPIGAFLSAVTRAVAQIASFIAANWQLIVSAILVAVAAWFWTAYYPLIISVFIRGYELTLVPLWRVVPLYLYMGLRLFIEWIWSTFINLFIVRLPSALITGLFFDTATCAADTWTLLITQTITTAIEFADAWDLWTKSGTAMLTVPPDFATFGQGIGNMIAALQNFFVCVCSGGALITAPFFNAFSQGHPIIVENTNQFACAVNATLNTPVALMTDIVRPIYLFSESISDGDTFIDAVRQSQPSFNLTLNTVRNVVNCTFGTLDNVIQQYYVLLLGSASDNSSVFTTNPGPPPYMFRCLTGILWFQVEIVKFATNIIFRLESTFTTFDGQTQLYPDEAIDVVLDSVYCACSFINWFADVLRAIGDDIAGGGAGTCSGTGGEDLGPTIGGCIFYVVAAMVDFVCCLVIAWAEFVAQSLLLLIKFLIGTNYTFVARIEDANDSRCNSISAEDVFYCSIYRHQFTLIFFDFASFLTGQRRDLAALPLQCPSEVCGLLKCSLDNDCSESAQYGVASQCDSRWDRCVDTPSSCQGTGPVVPATNCVSNPQAGQCSLGKCSGFSCPGSSPFDAEYDCTCECPFDPLRKFLLIGTQLAECVGRLFIETFGEGSEALQCFVVNYVSFIVEILDFTFDLASQFGIAITDPAALDLNTREILRAFLGICECVARILISLGESAGGASQDELEGLLQTIAAILICICELAVLAFDATAILIDELIQWFVSGTVPQSFTDLFVIVIKAFIQLIGLIFYQFSALFWALAAVPGFSDISEVAEAFFDVGTAIKEEACAIAEAVIDIIEFLAECIGGLIAFIFGLFACLADLAGGETETEACGASLFDPLIPCLEAIGELIIEFLIFLFDGIVEGILCVLRFLWCFIGQPDDVEDPQPVGSCISNSTCDDVNFLCILTDVTCLIGIPIDIGCDDACENPFLLCALWEVTCAIDLVIIDILDFIEDGVNFVIIRLNGIIKFVREDICYNIVVISNTVCNDFLKPLNDVCFTCDKPFIMREVDPPEFCCTSDGSDDVNETNFDEFNICSDDAFYNFDFVSIGSFMPPVDSDRDCINVEKFACYAHLTLQEFYNTAGSKKCCQSETGCPGKGTFIKLCPNMDLCCPNGCPSGNLKRQDEIDLSVPGYVLEIDGLNITFGNGVTEEIAMDHISTFNMTPGQFVQAFNNRTWVHEYERAELAASRRMSEEGRREYVRLMRRDRRATPATVLADSMVGEVLDAVDGSIAEASIRVGIIQSCSSHIRQTLTGSDDDGGGSSTETLSETTWPPMQQLVESQLLEQSSSMSLGHTLLASVQRIFTSSCVSLVDQYAQSLSVQIKLAPRTQAVARLKRQQQEQDGGEGDEAEDGYEFDANGDPRRINPRERLGRVTRSFFTMASNLQPTTLVWSFSQTLALPINTMRLLYRYAADRDNEMPRPTYLGLIGTPDFQERPEFCTATMMPAAVVADWLTPTVGTALRITLTAIKRGTQSTRDAYGHIQSLEPKPVVRSVLYLSRVAAQSGSRFARPELPLAFKRAAEAAFGSVEQRLARLARETARLEADDGVALLSIVVQPRSPEAAAKRQQMRRRFGLDARSIEERSLELTSTELSADDLERLPAVRTLHEHRRHATKKRQAQETLSGAQDGQISGWAGRTLERIDDRMTRLLRISKYGTDDLGEIEAILQERTLNGACDLRQSPWECCEEQIICTDCSFLDRVLWAGQNSIECIVDYYAGDFRSRFLPCIEQDAASANRMIVPLALRCPDAVCDTIECTNDEDCLLSDQADNSTQVVPRCNQLLGRCILQEDNECAGGDLSLTTCFEQLGPNQCTLGACGLNELCETFEPFDCNCQCPDTFLTEEKVVPFILSRLTELEVPCLLNLTCLVDSIVDDSTNLTVPEPNPLAGSWFTVKTGGTNDPTTPSVDISFVAALNTFDGLGSSIIGTLEDWAYQLSVATGDTATFENFFNEYVFCDYKDDWFCPLDGPVDPTCCSDRCETRLQGTNLFNGFVFATLMLIIPVTILAFCPLCTGFSGCFAALWLIIVIPTTMMLAYGGGFLCYTPGPVILLVPILGALVGLITVCANFCCCGTFCNSLVSMLTGFLRVFVIFATTFALLPPVTTCFGLDVYTLASEVIPPCFPLPPILVDRTQPGAAVPCGSFLNGGDLTELPSIIQCATTDQLPETRFLDGIDNILYLTEMIQPGANEALCSSIQGTVFSFIEPYCEAHTTEAHAVSEPLTEACFWITTPSILLSVVLLLLQAFVALVLAAAGLFVLSLIFLPLFWAGYAIWLMLDQVKNGWIYRFNNNNKKVTRDTEFMAGRPQDNA